MTACRAPAKPDRRRGPDGRFRCYKCPGELAVASALVRRAFAADFSRLRRRLAEELEQQQKASGEPTCARRELNSEDDQLFIALSGGDASLALLHVAVEQVQRRLRARLMQRQKHKREDSTLADHDVSRRKEEEADFGCCVALHVDMQRLFRRSADRLAVAWPVTYHTQAPPEGSAVSLHSSEKSEGYGVGLRLPVAASQSLPLQIQQAVARQWPGVRCVLLHPSGFEFSVVEDHGAEQQSECFAEVYRHPDGENLSQEQLQTVVQQELELRQLLARTFTEDKTSTQRLFRSIMLRAVRMYFARRLRSASCFGEVRPAFVCIGDSMSAAALALLERVTYGEGRLLGTEASLLDDRHLPLFHLCRPLVDLSKKELALFRRFEGLAVLPTQPYLLHEDSISVGEGGTPARNARPSVRWLLQDFLIDLQRDNAATLHNLISSCSKLEPTFTQWRQNEMPCCVCWTAPAVDLVEVLKEQGVFTARQKQVAEEHLLANASAKRLLCFACLRDATAGVGAAKVARTFTFNLREPLQ
ncbi:hypothetical protein Esti_000828 [Eimeria stiedai]